MIINLQGRKAHVRVIIHQEPCLLLEAMELAYSYVNKAPLEQLVASGEFAIPEKDVRISEILCAERWIPRTIWSASSSRGSWWTGTLPRLAETCALPVIFSILI